MGFGLIVSILLHAGLLAWALLNFHATDPFKIPDEIPVEVSIISQIDLETRQKKGDSLSKVEETMQAEGKAPSPKDAPKPKPVRAVEPPPAAAEPPPPPPPEPAKAEPPPPPKPDQIASLIEKTPPAPTPPPEPDGPTLEEKKKLEEKLAEQQRIDEQKRAEAEAKQKADEEARKKAEAEAKRKADELHKKQLADAKRKKEEAERKKAADKARQSKSFETQMAELLNKVPDQASQAQGQEAPPAKPTTAKGPAAGSKTGTDSVNKARAEHMIVSMLNAAFEQCWNKPLAGGGVAAPVVTLKWNLNPDGTVAGEAKVVQSDRGNPLADQAERSALRAVQTCAPFQLPPEQYGLWREITWKFNPNQTY